MTLIVTAFHIEFLSSPTFTKTHMMKVENGYEITIHAIGEIDPK